MGAERRIVEVDGHEVSVSNPSKPYFGDLAITKGDLVDYYLAVGDAVLAGVRNRPCVLDRHPDGVGGKRFHQKHLPRSRPDWLQGVTVRFPSGRTATQLCPADLAHVVWAVNLGCIAMHAWSVRADDLARPDELRVDLDPEPGVAFATVCEVTRLVGEILDEHGLAGYPKTSGSRGMHVIVPIERRWGFRDVRRACVALAREVERRAPEQATSSWWKEGRGQRVFIDYNQNLPDRSLATAYSARANPLALVSTPVAWDELAGLDPGAFTVRTVPARLAERGDLATEVAPGRLHGLLALAELDESDGLADAPWPPNFPKQPGEPPRVQPSRRAEPT